MSSILIANLEKRIRGWKIRADLLRGLYQEEGRLPTLWEAEEAEAMIQKLQKELQKRKGSW